MLFKKEINMRNQTLETKTMEISEADSLVLWRALQMYQNGILSNSSMANQDDADRADWLLAEVIHKSCDFAGTLDEGESIKSIYERIA